MEAIQAIPQPVIAQVHGVATAAGCQLAATCDLVVASEAASFATPGVKIGLFCSTPMVALTRAVPRKAAFEMLTTGRLIEAAIILFGAGVLGAKVLFDDDGPSNSTAALPAAPGATRRRASAPARRRPA